MMTDDQLYQLTDRFVGAFEKIALALEGLNDIARQHFEKQYPARGEPKDATISHIPTEEDRLRESQQGTGEWFSKDGAWTETPEEDIGHHEREWLKNHPDAGAQGQDEG